MSYGLIKESTLTGIADAIRAKNGASTTYKPSEMAAAIAALDASGSSGDSDTSTTISAVPVQSGTVTYSGGAQAPVWSGYNSDKLDIGGTYAGIDAGDYTATFTPSSGYYWSDGAQTTQDASWTISRMPVAVPTAGTLNYTGEELTAVWDYDEEQLTIGGTLSATEVGTYYATFTPTDNYCWEDGTYDTISVAWTIDKASAVIVLSATSVSLSESTLTAEVTVTATGEISISVEDESIATATLEDGVITVTYAALGSTTITVYSAESDSYAAGSATISVSCVTLSTTLADNTVSDIAAAAKEGIAASMWAVGDMIGIELSGTVGYLTFDAETYYAFIIGFDHNSEIEGANTIHFQFGKLEDGTDIAFVDSRYNGSGSSTRFHMNTSSTNSGGWESSYMRSTICPAFLEAMPEEWQAVITACAKYTDNVAYGAGSVEENVTATEDSIWLPAYYEIFGSSVANTYEADYQAQYEYYANGNSKIKYKHSDTSTACYWWLRSPHSSSTHSFRYVGTSGSGDYNANYSYGFAPGFMVA